MYRCYCFQAEEDTDCVKLDVEHQYFYVYGKSNKPGILDGSKLDSWIWEVDTCNAENCDLFTKTKLKAASVVSLSKIHVSEIDKLVLKVEKYLIFHIKSEDIKNAGLAATYDDTKPACFNMMNSMLCKISVKTLLTSKKKKIDQKIVDGVV